MSAVFGTIGTLGFIVFVVWLIIAFIKKKPKRIPLAGLLICFALMIGDAAISPSASASSSNPLMEAKEITQDVYNGSKTEVIGQECRVVISNEELKSITEDQFAEFVKNRVDGQSYNWYTIVCDDFGVQFYGCCSDTIAYGPIGSDPENFYVVDPVEGYIKKDNSGNYLIQDMQDSINTD